MSFQDILSPPVKNWCDLYVNSITAATGSSYSASETIEATWTGPYASGVTGNIFVSRLGDIVSLNFAGVTGTGVTGNSVNATAVLGDYAPVTAKAFAYPVVSGGTGAIGLCEIYETGNVSFFANAEGGAFAASGADSITPGSITYNLLG